MTTSQPGHRPADPSGRERARQAGRIVGSGAKVAGRGFAGAARVTGRLGRATLRQARRGAEAEGAGQSGLSRLIELHAFNAAGDAAVAISLAGTLFFQVPTGEARGQVALFLGLTMLPFAIVAPLIGPFLDRFAHGRRWAIGSTMAIRGLLCLALAGAVVDESGWLFPAALGVLVSSKAYGVTRAAAVPRLQPEGVSLVKANARTSLAGVVGVAVSAPLAGLAAYFGPEWSLRYAFLVFVLATIWAIRLPQRVDSSLGEGEMTLRGSEHPTPGRKGRPRMRIPGTVAFALRSNCGPRWMSGFLTMFMAFLLRENPIGDWRPEVLLGMVVGAAGLGNTLGIALASLLKRINPKITVVLALVVDAVMALVAALFYGLVPLLLLGLTAGLAQSLAKLSLDSTIQRDVRERVQTSAFARSDTTLQLAWVIGGFVGIAMPLMPRTGLGVACAVLTAWLVFVVATRPVLAVSARARPPAP
ncbi:MFS transporter [Nocardioides bigeumensis]|uniref:MFS transporter n=1 Tax=Nocardioides bigeumensis TaxID=433657 RepID=A0ABN2YL66_9ACTN